LKKEEAERDRKEKLREQKERRKIVKEIEKWK